MVLLGASTPSQSGPGSDGNKGVLCIPQSSSITGTSPLDCLVSYLGHSLVGCWVGCFTPFTEVQLVYSSAPADWAKIILNIKIYMQIYSFKYSN